MLFSMDYFKKNKKWKQFKINSENFLDSSHDLDDPWDSLRQKDAIEFCSKRILNDKKWKNGLEVGCGQGLLTPLWLNYCKNITCVDISKQAIDKAKKNLKVTENKNITFIKSDIHEFKIQKKYDLIILSYVFDYLGFTKFPQQTINLCQKLVYNLNKGGNLLLVNPVYGEEDFKTNLAMDKLWGNLGMKLSDGLIQGRIPESFTYRLFEKASNQKHQ